MIACAMAPGSLKFKLHMEGRSPSLPARREAEVLLIVGRMCRTREPMVGRRLVGTATLEADMKKFSTSSQHSHNRGGLRFRKRIAMIWIGRLDDGAKTSALIQDLDVRRFLSSSKQKKGFASDHGARTKGEQGKRENDVANQSQMIGKVFWLPSSPT